MAAMEGVNDAGLQAGGFFFQPYEKAPSQVPVPSTPGWDFAPDVH
jgi:hypothetical protein